MSGLLDLTGKRINRMTVLNLDHMDKHGRACWLCQCDCGNKKVVASTRIVQGNILDCGDKSHLKKEIKYKETPNGCHICTSHYRNHDGYPKMMINGKRINVSKFVFKQNHPESIDVNGNLPDKTVIRHSCDNRSCINPAHLILGTQAENVKDMMTRQRMHPQQGSGHGRAKLSDNDVLKIYNDTSTPAKVLARKFKIDSGRIHAIKCGNTWKHLLQPIAISDQILRDVEATYNKLIKK